MRFSLRQKHKEAAQHQSQIEYELIRYPRMQDMLYNSVCALLLEGNTRTVWHQESVYEFADCKTRTA